MREEDRQRIAQTEAFNQPPALSSFNLYLQDRVLCEAVQREGAGWSEARLSEYGMLAGGEMQGLGFQANSNAPLFRSHDLYGQRVDLVEYHPAYHRLMQLACRHGLHNLPWKYPQPGAHVARAALNYLHHQVEAGTGCPVTMTFAAFALLAKEAVVGQRWISRLLADDYDGRNVPLDKKASATLGMAMTEKQGGSDVRANTSCATALGRPGSGQAYELTGHKWFCSAPMSDAFVMIAQTPGGLSCFLTPRWRPDGTHNALHLQQLKNKLGNRSNASAEVELHGAYAQMLGQEGRGIASILKMVALTRFDCITGSAALMRQAVIQAIHFARYRSVFGNLLIEQPLMKNVLADLCLESEAALHLSMRLARALDEMSDNPAARLLLRLATPIGKYWVCKRAPGHIYEAMECLGGQGYVEDSILPRLYREAPVNSIWEGSGNIQCLDVLRVIREQADSVSVFMDEVKQGKGGNRHLDRFIDALQVQLQQGAYEECMARDLVGKMALALQASLLVRSASHAVADAFCAARLLPGASLLYGALPEDSYFEGIIGRAAVAL